MEQTEVHIWFANELASHMALIRGVRAHARIIAVMSLRRNNIGQRGVWPRVRFEGELLRLALRWNWWLRCCDSMYVRL